VNEEKPAPRDSPGGEGLTAWSFLWAVCLFMAVAAVPGWYAYVLRNAAGMRGFVEIGFVLVALALVSRPSGLSSLTVLAAFQIAEAAFFLPELPNNRWVATFLNLALLATVARGFSFLRFQAAGRTIVVILYAFATFAKLNTDFLDPSTSCAGEFYGHVAEWLPLPDGREARIAAPWGTLAIEGLLPPGLLFTRGRLRHAVIALGILFHFGLALDLGKHFLNFSAVMTGGLLLFLTPSALAEIARPIMRRRSLLALALSVELALGFLDSLGAPLELAFLVARQTIYGGVALWIAARVIRLPVEREIELARPNLAASMVVALAILNGLSPYLGLKTRTGFDMYGNLRMEAERSNHLLVPRSLDVLGLLADRGRILDADARGRARGLAPGTEWPWLELSRRLASEPPPRVVYERAGKRFVFDPAKGSRVPPPPWLLGKLLVFRPIGRETRGLCVW
jgi:hypothetical protein